MDKPISLPVDNLSLYLLKLQFTYFGLLAWYRIVQNYLSSGFKYLKIGGTFGALPLDPTRWITLPSPIQCPMDPSYVGNANWVLAKQCPDYIIFLKFVKIYYICVCIYIYIYRVLNKHKAKNIIHI